MENTYKSFQLTELKLLLEADVKNLNTYITSEANFKGYDKYVESLRDAKLDIKSQISSLNVNGSSIPSSGSKLLGLTYKLGELEQCLEQGKVLELALTKEEQQYDIVKKMANGQGVPKEISQLLNSILTSYEKIISQTKRNKTIGSSNAITLN